MAIGNMRQLWKWCGIMLDIFSVSLVLFVVNEWFMPHEVPCLCYLAGMLLTVMVLYVFDVCNAMYSYTVQRKRQPLTLAVGLGLSAVVLSAVLLITRHGMAWVGIVWGIFAACYLVLLVCRCSMLTVFLSILGSQTLLVMYDKNADQTVLYPLLYRAVDYGTIRTHAIAEGEFDEIKAEMRRADSIVLLGDIPHDIADASIVLAKCLAKPLYVASAFADICLMNSKLTHIGDVLVLAMENKRKQQFQMVVKRLFDIFASAVGLVLLSPFFAIIALAIKIDTGGSVFYKQERYTIHKQRFDILKFRTMVEGAEKDGVRLAAKHDSRITRSGRILRRFRLDELPQLINILRGEMSIVGPRPERPAFADEFSVTVDNYDLRYQMKAGLTGFAQVYGGYTIQASDKALLDWIYINRFSLWLDVKLIIQTLMVLFIKEASMGVAEEDMPFSAGENQELSMK